MFVQIISRCDLCNKRFTFHASLKSHQKSCGRFRDLGELSNDSEPETPVDNQMALLQGVQLVVTEQVASIKDNTLIALPQPTTSEVLIHHKQQSLLSTNQIQEILTNQKAALTAGGQVLVSTGMVQSLSPKKHVLLTAKSEESDFVNDADKTILEILNDKVVLTDTMEGP